MDTNLYGQMALKQTNNFLKNPTAFIYTDENKLDQQINEIQSMLD